MGPSSFSGTTVDPAAYLFPKAGKCTYREFGPSDDVRTIDALCSLPLNVLNEKVFVAVWFCFVFVAVASICGLSARLVSVVNKRLRFYISRVQSRFALDAMIEIVVDESSYGEWFQLHMFGENANPFVLKELTVELAYEIGVRKCRDREF